MAYFSRNLASQKTIMVATIKVPSVGESITEVTLVKWIKKTG